MIIRSSINFAIIFFPSSSDECTFAGMEQWTWKSTSTSILVGVFLKLMAVKWRSSTFDRLKVN